MKIEMNNQTLTLLKCSVYGFKINHNAKGYFIDKNEIKNESMKNAPIVEKLNKMLNDYKIFTISEKNLKKELLSREGKFTKIDIINKLWYARGCCGYIIGSIIINGKEYK